MPLDGTEKELIEQLGKGFEEFKTVHQRELSELRKGIADVVTKEQLSRIDADLTKLSEAKDKLIADQAARLDDVEKKLNRRGRGGEGDDAEVKELARFNVERKSVASARGATVPRDDVGVEDYRAYKAAFVALVRKGNVDMLAADERKALQVGVDTDGGLLVPADTSGRIIQRIYETSPVRQIASIQTISTDQLEGLNDLDQAGPIGWVGETAPRTETGTPNIGKWSIPVHESYSEPRATQKLLDDASVDIEAWLANKVADRFARGENTTFVVGDGVAKPRGFTDYPTAATDDATRAWGTLQHRNTGANGAFASGATAPDVLFDVIGDFKDFYLQNARWVTRREVITLIRKFKEATTNAYIWQPGLQQGTPQSLLGFPVSVMQDMPALAAASLSMGFGDFREGYQIVDRVGIRVLRDNLTSKPYVKFYTTKRVGGGVLNFEAIKFVRFST